MYARISLKRALENELKGTIITDKTIGQYLPEDHLEFKLFDGTIEDLASKAILDDEWHSSTKIYLVNTTESLEDNDKYGNIREEYIWIWTDRTDPENLKGHYELVGSTKITVDSYIVDEDGKATTNPVNGVAVEEYTKTVVDSGITADKVDSYDKAVEKLNTLLALLVDLTPDRLSKLIKLADDLEILSE